MSSIRQIEAPLNAEGDGFRLTGYKTHRTGATNREVRNKPNIKMLFARIKNGEETKRNVSQQVSACKVILSPEAQVSIHVAGSKLTENSHQIHDGD